jgi:hypothetical protein
MIPVSVPFGDLQQQIVGVAPAPYRVVFIATCYALRWPWRNRPGQALVTGKRWAGGLADLAKPARH